MIWKVNEYVYFEKDKYTFIEQKILDGYLKVYCLVAVNGDEVHGLWEGLEKPSKEEKDKAIKSYLKNGRRLINFEYAKAKPMIELTSYKIGE